MVYIIILMIDICHNFAFELEAFDKGSSYTITSNDLCFGYCFNEKFKQIIDRNKLEYCQVKCNKFTDKLVFHSLDCLG